MLFERGWACRASQVTALLIKRNCGNFAATVEGFVCHRSFLSNSGQQKGPSTPFTLSSVRTASDIILSIGELSEEIAEEAFCALKGLLNSRQGHVVFEAACCIRCVAIASPSRASLMLEGLLEDAKKFSNLITARALFITLPLACASSYVLIIVPFIGIRRRMALLFRLSLHPQTTCRWA